MPWRRRVDGRSDLFSAGATLFEMVAGERAFQGRNVTEVSHRIQNDSLPLLPAHVRAVAPRLQLVLERAMEKHPEDRFDTGTDMAEALRQVLSGSRARQNAHPARGRRRSARWWAAVVARDSVVAGAAPAARSGAAEDGGGKAPGLCRSGRPHSGPDGAGSRPLRRRPLSELALSVPDEADRERFRREVASLARTSASPAPRRRSFAERQQWPRPDPAVRAGARTGTGGADPVRRTDRPHPGAPRGRQCLVDRGSLAGALKSHRVVPAERAAFLKRRPG